MAKKSDNLMALLDRLEKIIPKSRRLDAIDAMLTGEPRTTGVRSLRDHGVVRQFRRELAEGLIRVDTANKLLTLIRALLDAAM